MTTIKVKLSDIKTSKGRTSKEELDKLSDKDIAEAVLGDEDAQIPTEKDLKSFGKPKKRGEENEKES